MQVRTNDGFEAGECDPRSTKDPSLLLSAYKPLNKTLDNHYFGLIAFRGSRDIA
jgi:hypothetical protein